MDINKIFDGSLDDIANNIFNEAANTTAEAKAIRQQKIAENVQFVIEALRKIESDINSRYDSIGNALEKRILSIKDGRDGINGSDGRNGKDGRNGRDGLPGLRGADGKPGKDGIDGIDGVSVTNAHIDFDGSLIITLSSGKEINVGEVIAPSLADQIKVITNGGGTSQSVLDTLTSLQSQINALSGATIYKGLWNASTNSPALTSSVGTSGNFYIVSVAGSTSLDGITNWGVGDWAIFNGSVWQRVEGGSEGNFTTLSVSGQSTLSGNVGIGTASPNTALTLGTTNPVLSFYQPDSTYSLSRSSTAMILNSAGSTTVTSGSASNMEVRNGFIQFKTGAGAGTTERMRIDSSGIVLVGTVSASGTNLLQVNSDALINTLTVGRGPGNKQDNAVLGYQALNNGGANVGSSVAIGYQALFTATAAGADRQVAIGYQALYSNNDSTGAVNIGIGYLAGKAATGKSNLFIGGYCSYLRTTGDYNTFVGGSSGTNFSSVPTGNSNTALGASSLGSLTTGYANVSIGYSTGTLLATGACNVFVGEVAGYNATGSRNVFVGGGNSIGSYSAGQTQTTGDVNTYIGSAAGGLMTTGSYNVILGGYTGNSGGLDMRALNNYIVLSDGLANIRQVIDSSGNVLIGKVSATANGGDLQVSKGITFPATQVAASDPNTLDDYEEGTWTPSLQFDGAAVGMTYTTRTGKYTKVGNLVTINCRIELSAKGSSTGVARIASLPFAASSSQSLPPPFVTGLVTATSVGMALPASTSIDLYNAQWNYSAALTDANLSNTSRIEFTVSYLA